MLLKIWQNSQENTSLGVSFLINVFKKRLRHKCFFVNFVKFFRTCIIVAVFTYLSSNIQNCTNILLRRIPFDFIVNIFKESHTKKEANKSKVIISAGVIISYRVITRIFFFFFFCISNPIFRLNRWFYTIILFFKKHGPQ